MGPIIRNICFQWYLFIATRTLVRTEGLLTQLVFEHSLRIRLKAEASNEKIEDNFNVSGTQDSASVTEGTSVDSNSGERTSQSSTTVSRDSSSDSQSTSNGLVKGKDSSTLKSDTKSATKDKKEAQNLIGKINNLVTTDLGNIVDGRDFLMISMLQCSNLSLGLLSDTLASSNDPIPISSVHHLLIPSTGMEVGLPSYFKLKE